jgi:hypothetical protein
MQELQEAVCRARRQQPALRCIWGLHLSCCQAQHGSRGKCWSTMCLSRTTLVSRCQQTSRQ